MGEHTIGAAETLLRDGEMRRFDLDGKAIVVARVNGEYFAFRSGCSHYGGALEQGALKGYTVMCPLHHACFDIRSGVRTEPPALNNIPAFPLRIENGQVIVTSDGTAAQPPELSTDSRHFVIIGGGAAGEAAAEELRRAGFGGAITLISAVNHVPIDRPNVSKDYLDGHAKPEWMPLRDGDWFTQRKIELKLNSRVTKIDPAAKTLYLADGTNLHYDKLLVATGATPRTLPVPGADLNGIYTLREIEDADNVIAAVKAGKKRVVIVGASFIGAEAAASLRQLEADVTVVGLEAVPFERVMGTEIGLMFQKVHEENGVQFRLSSGVKEFTGENGLINGVTLSSGEHLPADFVLLGVGVAPTTKLLADSGFSLTEKERAVRVNPYLQTEHADIYAAGDIARYENANGESTRIEHWRVAQQQGVVAARNMLDQQQNINAHVPFFWTKQWGISLRYVGHAEAWDEIIYRGSPADRKFIAFFVKGGRLLAAAGVGHDAEMAALEFILRDQIPLTADQMRDSGFDLIAHATRA